MNNMTFPLIPRVRVNYSFADVFKAMFVSEKTAQRRNDVKHFLSSYFDTPNVLLTSSGRAGIYMVLRFLPQKKVFIPAYTCMVVVEAAMLAGKEIHYAHTSDLTFNADDYEGLDDDSIVIATHQYGLPCDIVHIVEYAHQKGAIVLEDCAAAFGSRVDGKLVGTFGDFSAFSFDPSKLINVPNKAGFILAKNESDLQGVAKTTSLIENDFFYKSTSLKEGLIYCLLKNKWVYRVFHYCTMGRKHKMQLSEHDTPQLVIDDYYTHGFSEWQAVFVMKQLKQLDKYITRRKEIFERYDLHIQNNQMIKPIINPEAVCIRYTIKVKQKETLYYDCLRQGVDMGFSFNHIGTPKTWINEHRISSEILNLPYYYSLRDKEVDRVINVLNNWK